MNTFLFSAWNNDGPFVYQFRFALTDDMGYVIEPDDVPEDIYPFSLVDEPAELDGQNGDFGIKGSCATYKKRKGKE